MLDSKNGKKESIAFVVVYIVMILAAELTLGSNAFPLWLWSFPRMEWHAAWSISIHGVGLLIIGSRRRFVVKMIMSLALFTGMEFANLLLVHAFTYNDASSGFIIVLTLYVLVVLVFSTWSDRICKKGTCPNDLFRRK